MYNKQDGENEGGISVGYQALYRVWRPQQFIDVVGQEHVTKTLQNALSGKRFHMPIYFPVHVGQGKRVLPKFLQKQ